MKVLRFVFVLLFFMPVISSAQEDLTLSQAIEIGLENNYQISIAEKNIEIAKNNNTWKAAGRYPSINLNLSNNNSFAGQNNPASFLQEFTSLSGGLNGSVDGSYILFDGHKFKINKKRFEVLEKQSEGNVKIAIEQTIQNIILAYYNAAIQKENVNTVKELLKLSRDRIDYQKVKAEFGQAGKFDLLQSEDAYFNDSTSYLVQLNGYEIALQNLSLTMGIDDFNKRYNPTDGLTYDGSVYNFEDLKKKMLDSNQSLKNLYVTQSLTAIEIESAKSFNKPTVAVNGGLGLGGTVSSLNVIEPSTFPVDNPNTQRNYNVYVNFTANYPLYDGGNRKRNIENATIQENIAQLNIEDFKRNLSTQLNNTLANYNNQVRLLELTSARVDNAKENISIAEERFKAAQINSFDYRTIQLNYLNATQSYLQAIFNLKNTETELIRLTGGLIR